MSARSTLGPSASAPKRRPWYRRLGSWARRLPGDPRRDWQFYISIAALFLVITAGIGMYSAFKETGAARKDAGIAREDARLAREDAQAARAEALAFKVQLDKVQADSACRSNYAADLDVTTAQLLGAFGELFTYGQVGQPEAQRSAMETIGTLTPAVQAAAKVRQENVDTCVRPPPG